MISWVKSWFGFQPEKTEPHDTPKEVPNPYKDVPKIAPEAVQSLRNAVDKFTEDSRATPSPPVPSAQNYHDLLAVEITTRPIPESRSVQECQAVLDRVDTLLRETEQAKQRFVDDLRALSTPADNLHIEIPRQVGNGNLPKYRFVNVTADAIVQFASLLSFIAADRGRDVSVGIEGVFTEAMMSVLRENPTMRNVSIGFRDNLMIIVVPSTLPETQILPRV